MTQGPTPRKPAVRSAARTGLIYAICSYGIWGFLPLYFLLLAPTGAFEIVAWRVLFSLVFCGVLILATRAWRPLVAALRTPRVVWTMGLAGVLIFINWQTFILAALSGHVVETALGYFINPIITVLLGVLVLHERLRAAQWAAVVISFIAVIVLSVGYGTVPWISLILAFSFGLYGLIKKRVGGHLDALTGLTLETMWLAPIAIVQLVVVSLLTGLTFGTVSPLHTVALIGSGVITAVPLLFFAAASRRLPLSTLGLVQYLAPVLQLIVGVVVLQEPMPPERWLGFGLVWVALIVLTVDMIVAGRSQRRLLTELV
ncbi:EamA family transporter RarD [Cryobacterium sp. PAMC25264]|uniref:EamA family transporter RarD n=1 Tax=Cryobacterium sp. PAMC25264 TaxID=2861288 RepID=UPI001C632EDC|nr:EamA family transporter RarD [Cryobacterium sp. PAMC25264]QYF72607.1 EamA family transporter RarD [Cryobacterium sp. PAMC25264]